MLLKMVHVPQSLTMDLLNTHLQIKENDMLLLHITDFITPVK